MTKLPQFSDYITGTSNTVQNWLLDTVNTATTGNTYRNWCTLNIEDLTELGLAKYFDRSALGDSYTDQFNQNTVSNTPYAFLQLESDLIFSLHKCFVSRYRGRLMSYRDDCAQKNYHIYSAISQGIGKYNYRKTAEAQRLQQTPNSAES